MFTTKILFPQAFWINEAQAAPVIVPRQAPPRASALLPSHRTPSESRCWPGQGSHLSNPRALALGWINLNRKLQIQFQQLVISPVRKTFKGVAKRLSGDRSSARVTENSTPFSRKSRVSWCYHRSLSPVPTSELKYP